MNDGDDTGELEKLEQIEACRLVQSKYEQPGANTGLLAGGTENWVGVVADEVDRYGFIVKPSTAHASAPSVHTPLKARLRPSNMKLRAALVVRPASIDKTQASQREARREMKWSAMSTRVVDEDGTISYTFASDKLVKRTFKGVPDAWRAAAWHAFLTRSAQKKPGFIPDLVLSRAYSEYLSRPSVHDPQIDLDVPRTIDSHVMFSARYKGGQRLLFRVLHALSLHCESIGYVQGMAPLAATLLCYYDEAACFVMLVRLFATRQLDELYAAGFAGLMRAFSDLHGILRHRKVGKALDSLSIEPTLYATKWYLTLFSYSVPFSTQLRIWDVFFLLDPGSLAVVHAAALTLIDSMRSVLVTADFDTAMQLISHPVDVHDNDLFMNVLEYEYNLIRTRVE